MTRSSIGGRLDMAALAALTEHRPSDPALLAREARGLIALGMTVSDVAQALGLTPSAVAQLLGEVSGDGTE
jgi:hypothetical protein